MTVTVTTQTELDQALADRAETVYIQSEEGVWLTLTDTGSSHVVARGSSHVVARGSSHVEAWGSSHVVAWDSSHVVAWDSSHVVARDSSHVEARGSSHVEAWDSSHVEAGKLVAVHLHSQRVQLAGGVVIDMTAVDYTDPQTWCDIAGVKVVDGIATLYKAVDPDYHAGQHYIRTSYAPGSTPAAQDWRDDNRCGGGLHFGPTPAAALRYANCPTWKAKFLAVGVAVADLRPITSGSGTIPDKCKAPRVVTPCVEVDRYGKVVQQGGA